MAGNDLIAPSILSADFARLGEEVERVITAGADLIHFDVMDNHYVPNLTIGPLVCAALRKHGITAPIDVHLMVKPVDRIVPDFGKAGATYITFHPEASEHVDRTISLIRESGAKPGLVFNPATPLDWLDHTLEKIDMILLMSVNPGFAGQKFITSVLPKRWRGQGRQHRHDRTGRCGHVRGGLGDLREPGLCGDHSRDASRNRQGTTQSLTFEAPRRSAATSLLLRPRPRRHHPNRHHRRRHRHQPRQSCRASSAWWARSPAGSLPSAARCRPRWSCRSP
jgi:ribulose-phosphate 3-epimerase